MEPSEKHSTEKGKKKHPGYTPPPNRPEKNIPVGPDTDNDHTNPLPDAGTPPPAVDPTRIDEPELPHPGKIISTPEINRQQSL